MFGYYWVMSLLIVNNCCDGSMILRNKLFKITHIKTHWESGQ